MSVPFIAVIIIIHAYVVQDCEVHKSVSQYSLEYTI